MTAELALRLAFTAVFLAMIGISIRHRRAARRATGGIPRAAEDRGLIAGRLLIAVPLYGSVLLHMIRPQWLAWAQLALPMGLRWAGIAVATAMLPMVHWTLANLGTSVSETILTRAGQRLVTTGPYRWIRHPLYTFALIALAGLGLAAASAFMLLFIALAMAGIRFVAVREEANLRNRFGEVYAGYMTRTGRFLPQLRHPD